MKKVLALILVLATVLVMTACGSNNAATPAGDSSTGNTTYKVAMICDSSISDGGWGMACYNAMVDACKKHGWSYEVTDSIDQSAYYESIAAYCDLGCNLIYAPGNQYTDAVLQAAKNYPKISFALLNGAESTPAKAENNNVMSLLPNATQIGWIAGALAGLMTKSNTIAFIGGKELDTTLAKYKGYTEAAQYVAQQDGRTVKVLDPVYAGSFSATDKGIEFAKAMMDQGADVFFGDASAVDSGARQAIDTANTAAGSIKTYDIGQPSDLLGQNACVICSQVTDNSSLVGLAMEAVEKGTFGGTTIFGTMQNGVLSAGKMNELIPQDMQAKYQGYIDQMTKETFMK